MCARACLCSTRLGALDFFDPIAGKLGPRATRELFLKPMTSLFDCGHTELRVRLLNQKFLGRLLERFETIPFVDHFLG